MKRETPEEDNDSCGDFKITIKAHFQIAQPKIDDPASFRFKAKSGGGVQKITVASNKFKCMEDVFVIIKQLSDRDAKCGSFDVYYPKPLRILSYSALDSKFTMSDDDLLDFPVDFLHIQYNKAIEFAVLNIPTTSSGKIERHRNQQFSSSSAISSSNEIIVIDDADDSSAIITTTIVGFDKETLTLGFDFDHGRFVHDDVKDHSKPLSISVSKNAAKFLK